MSATPIETPSTRCALRAAWVRPFIGRRTRRPGHLRAGDDDNNEPKTIAEAADLILRFGRRRKLDEGVDDKPTAPEGSVARFIVDCAARARGEEPEPARLPKVAELDLSPVIAKLLAASAALAADPGRESPACERGSVMLSGRSKPRPVDGDSWPTPGP